MLDPILPESARRFNLTENFSERGPSPGLILITDSSNSSTTVTVNPKFYAIDPSEKPRCTATDKGTNGQAIKDEKISWKSSSPEVAKGDQ